MQYILDRANITGLLAGRLILKDTVDAEYLAAEEQWRQLKNMPDNAVKLSLLSRIGLGRAFAITEFLDRDPIIEQNGYELPEIVYVYRKTFSREPTSDVEADLHIIEVALNEGAALVTDEADLRELIALLDGESVASADVLAPAK